MSNSNTNPNPNTNTNNMNQQGNPFWDFVASMQHDPRMNGYAAAGNPPPPPFEGQPYPWGGPFGAMPYRGRHGGRHGRRSPTPEDDTNGEEGTAGPRAHREHKGKGHRGPKHNRDRDSKSPADGTDNEMEERTLAEDDSDSRSPTPPTPGTEKPHKSGCHGYGRRHHSRGSPGPGARQHSRGPHGPRPHSRGPFGIRGGEFGGRGGKFGGGRGGKFGMRGGPGEGPGPRHHHHHGGPRGFGGPGGPGGFGGFGGPGPRAFGGRGGRHHGPPGGPRGRFPFDLNALVEALAPGVFGADKKVDDAGMFHPELDLFDTPEAYILHLSLPGAKKPDLSITYAAARNSVTVSGVVARPGVDEEMMDALALDERKVGAFEREVKLEDGVKIDEEGINAKLEDGVLKVVVPKMMQEEDEDYVDIKRITLE